MFGRDLDETMAVEARLGGSYIPILVHRCAKYIREHGECTCVCVVCMCMQCLCACDTLIEFKYKVCVVRINLFFQL